MPPTMLVILFLHHTISSIASPQCVVGCVPKGVKKKDGPCCKGKGHESLKCPGPAHHQCATRQKMPTICVLGVCVHLPPRPAGYPWQRAKLSASRRRRRHPRHLTFASSLSARLIQMGMG